MIDYFNPRKKVINNRCERTLDKRESDGAPSAARSDGSTSGVAARAAGRSVGLAVGATSSSEDGVAARELPDLLVEGLLTMASQREQSSVAPEKLPAPSAIQISYIFNLQQQQQYKQLTSNCLCANFTFLYVLFAAAVRLLALFAVCCLYIDS